MPTFWKPAKLPLTDVFIETGTNRGDSLAVAIGTGYPLCMSVEFVENLYLFAKERFEMEPRAKLFHGSSPAMLPLMIDPLKTTTFWLDAHYCGTDQGMQDPRYGECPLLAELEAITSVPWQHSPIICIDDAFIFRDIHWERSGSVFEPSIFTRSHWPRMADIEEILSGYAIHEESYVLFCQRKSPEEEVMPEL